MVFKTKTEMRELLLNMMSSIKLTKQTLCAVILCLIFTKPNLVEGKIFDRIVAKVNSEIITLSSIERKGECSKGKI